jgi:hypothetical protein
MSRDSWLSRRQRQRNKRRTVGRGIFCAARAEATLLEPFRVNPITNSNPVYSQLTRDNIIIEYCQSVPYRRHADQQRGKKVDATRISHSDHTWLESLHGEDSKFTLLLSISKEIFRATSIFFQALFNELSIITQAFQKYKTSLDDSTMSNKTYYYSKQSYGTLEVSMICPLAD